MCDCQHHWDKSKSCTCTCDHHEDWASWRARSPELFWLGIALGVVGVIMLVWAVTR